MRTTYRSTTSGRLLPESEFRHRPWRIHEVTDDFDLLDARTGPDFVRLPFTSLYLLQDEFAAELANSTCQGVLHLGWVETESGCYTAQLAVLAKPNGTKGRLYLTEIQPFRHALIYPSLLRTVGRSWAAHGDGDRP